MKIVKYIVTYLLIGLFLSVFISPNTDNFSNLSDREQGILIISLAVSYPILIPLMILVYLADFIGYLL